jgi:Ca2+-binding EF-hand superfamily protein
VYGETWAIQKNIIDPEESFRSADPGNTGKMPTFRFFRALTVSQFKMSQGEMNAIEREFRVDDITIDYERFLSALVPPKSVTAPDVRVRLCDSSTPDLVR